MTARRALAGSSLAMLASSVVLAASGYATQAGLARVLGVADFGAFNVALAAASGTAILVTSGLPVALSRQLAASPPGEAAPLERAAKRLHARVTAGVTLAFLLLAGGWAAAVGDPRLLLAVLVSAAILPCYAVAGYLWNALVGHGRFGEQAATSVLGSLAKVALAVGGALAAGLAGALLGYAAAALVQAAAAWAVHRRVPHGPPGSAAAAPAPATASLRLGRTGAEAVAIAAATAYVPTLDVLLFATLDPPGPVLGEYAAASTVGRVPLLLASGLSLLAMPVVARSGLAAGQEGASLVRPVPASLAALGLALAAVGPALVPLLFGPGYRGAAGVLPWLVAAGCLMAAAAFLGQVLFALGRGRAALAAFGAAAAAVALVAWTARALGTGDAAAFAQGAFAGGAVAAGLGLAVLASSASGTAALGPWSRAAAVAGAAALAAGLAPAAGRLLLAAGAAVALALAFAVEPRLARMGRPPAPEVA